MRKKIAWLWLWTVLTLPAWGAEKYFDFGEPTTNRVPSSFRSLRYGGGKPAEWKILFDDVPPLLAPLSDRAPSVAKRTVLAQVSQDPTDERFPMLIYDGETFGDFTLTTRFKLVSGTAEQMAGIVFRMQDEKNFYVVRASGLGSNLAFYKVIDGERISAFRGDIPVPKDVWHELKLKCEANKIYFWLNDKVVILPLVDDIPRILNGKIGFLTKSDAVSYFTDTRITYVPREIPAQVLVRDAVKKYPRLQGLKVYTLNSEGAPTIVASKDETDKGLPGGKFEKDCIAKGNTFYGRDRKMVSVVMPLRDRNGDVIAAVRVMMEAVTGQTEQNAIVRALPIVKEMQERVQTLTELTQ